MRSISQLLEDVFVHETDGNPDHISLGEVVDSLSQRGFGMMMILFSIPAALPATPPFLPILFALPLCFMSIQMIAGHKQPFIPGFLARRSLKRTLVRSFMERAVPYIKRVEMLVRPRLEWLSTAKAERILGIFLLVINMGVLIPLPLTNSIFSLAVVIIGIGILTRDGFFVVGGIVIGLTLLCVLGFLSSEIYQILSDMFT